MKIYILSPKLTIGDDPKAEFFYQELIKYMKEYIEVSDIGNLNRVLELKMSLDRDSILVIFNTENEYDEKIINLLEKANNIKALVWPVAMNEDTRLPVDIINLAQSFDLKARLENRKTSNIAIIAQILSREIISRAFPTFYAEDRKLLFVSHKRLDGEEIVSKLCDKINLLARTRDRHAGREAFRDVIEVKVGEAAQDIIDSALARSDVLIFLHTPMSINAPWIQKELVYALLNGIPILWIQIDNASIKGLRVLPSEKPHLIYKSSDFDDDIQLENCANKIEELCFKLVMNKRINVWEQRERFECWSQTHNVEIEEVDRTLQIFKAIYKENRAGKYERRPIIQYLQYFGRQIGDEDVACFIKYLSDNTESRENYDTAVMLSCNEHMENVKLGCYKNGFQRHLEYWKKEVDMEEKPRKNKKIVVLGAFPDYEEYNKYVMTDALKIFSQEIISNGYTLVYGAHPTFQKLIFAVAEEETTNPKQAVKMYISKYFTYEIDELQKWATICETERKENKEESLTYMREQMLGDSDIAAVVCVGGRIKEETNEREGVNEEIEISRKNNLPVFLLGTVGGFSERKAEEYYKKGNWHELNDAGEVLNEMFRSSLEYRKIFKKLNEYIENKHYKNN